MVIQNDDGDDDNDDYNDDDDNHNINFSMTRYISSGGPTGAEFLSIGGGSCGCGTWGMGVSIFYSVGSTSASDNMKEERQTLLYCIKQNQH